MKNILLRLALLTLALMLALSQTAAAAPAENLRAIYDALVAEDSEFSYIVSIFELYGLELKASLEENSITITLIIDGEVDAVWPFVQDGSRLTTVAQPDDIDVEDMADMLLLASVAAQGLNPVLFDGYTSAHPELLDQLKIIEKNGAEQRVSIDIAGPYEYDMEELNTLVMSEEYLRGCGLSALGEGSAWRSLNYGKVSLEYFGSSEGLELVVKEYGGLDDLALQDILCAVSILQPQGWMEFAICYTAMEDADGAQFFARANLEGDALTALESHPTEGYSYAYIAIGPAFEGE